MRRTPGRRRVRWAQLALVVALVVVGAAALRGLAPERGSRAVESATAGRRPALVHTAALPPTDYVALGDSYSAGSGAGNAGDDPCTRSDGAFPLLLGAGGALGPLSLRACSGAVTSDLFAPSGQTAAQFDALSSDTKFVSLTIGGNDLGFSSILARCVRGTYLRITVLGEGGCAGRTSLRTDLASRLSALAGLGEASSPSGTPIYGLRTILAEIRARAPRAAIFVAGYPRLFGAVSGTCTIGAVHETLPVGGRVRVGAEISSADATFVDAVIGAYDAVVEDAASGQSGVRYVDADPYFAGHRLCDRQSGWINPITGSGSVTGDQHLDNGSIHPNAAGQRWGYARAFAAAGLTE